MAQQLSILDLFDDVFKVIVTHLGLKTRFGTFSLVCKKFVSLAASAPLFTLDFQTDGPLARFFDFLQKGIYGKDFDPKKVYEASALPPKGELVEALGAFFRREPFFSRLPLAAVQSLYIRQSSLQVIPILNTYFPNVVELKFHQLMYSAGARMDSDFVDDFVDEVRPLVLFKFVKKLDITYDAPVLSIPIEQLETLRFICYFRTGSNTLPGKPDLRDPLGRELTLRGRGLTSLKTNLFVPLSLNGPCAQTFPEIFDSFTIEKSFQKLTHLELENVNQRQRLELEGFESTSLTSLSISHSFHDFGATPTLTHAKLPNLRTLTLNGCNFFERNRLEGLNNLETLKLYATKGAPDFLYPFTSLQRLEIGAEIRFSKDSMKLISEVGSLRHLSIYGALANNTHILALLPLLPQLETFGYSGSEFEFLTSSQVRDLLEGLNPTRLISLQISLVALDLDGAQLVGRLTLLKKLQLQYFPEYDTIHVDLFEAISKCKSLEFLQIRQLQTMGSMQANINPAKAKVTSNEVVDLIASLPNLSSLLFYGLTTDIDRDALRVRFPNLDAFVTNVKPK